MLIWPGLPNLWIRGSWAGLVLAVGFTVLVCILLAGTWIWNEWLSTTVQYAGFGMAGVIWIGSAMVAIRSDFFTRIEPPSNGPRDGIGLPGTAGLVPDAHSIPPEDDLFPRAQAQYLNGDWLACEQTLGKLLAQNRRDVEARLLLATLCRHLHRTAEASEHLAVLERLESAERWAYEIAMERHDLAGSPRPGEEPVENSQGDIACTTHPIFHGEIQGTNEKISRTDAA